MPVIRYNYLIGIGDDNGVAPVAIPANATDDPIISFGGWPVKDPGGTITDSATEVYPSDPTSVTPPNANEPNPAAQLIGTFVSGDAGYISPTLLFACPPGQRIVVRSWVILSTTA